MEVTDTTRGSVRIVVVNHERYEPGAFVFDGTLDDIIKALTTIRDSIPEEYRADATCTIDSESGWEGSHSPSIEIAYYRPETDEEVARRLQRRADGAAAKEADERRTLAQLSAKYGKPS